jgi:hypothetical protein
MSDRDVRLPPRYGIPVIGPLQLLAGWSFDALTRTRYTVIAPPAEAGGTPHSDDHPRWFVDAYLWAQIVAEPLPATARVEVVRRRFGRVKTVAVRHGMGGDMID